MLSIFTEVAAVGYNELMFLLRFAWLTPKFLPRPIRDLLIGRARLTSITCGVLDPFVIEELHNRNHTRGLLHVVQLTLSREGPRSRRSIGIGLPCILSLGCFGNSKLTSIAIVLIQMTRSIDGHHQSQTHHHAQRVTEQPE